jgi:hypothetical protein
MSTKNNIKKIVDAKTNAAKAQTKKTQAAKNEMLYRFEFTLPELQIIAKGLCELPGKEMLNVLRKIEMEAVQQEQSAQETPVVEQVATDG